MIGRLCFFIIIDQNSGVLANARITKVPFWERYFMRFGFEENISKKTKKTKARTLSLVKRHWCLGPIKKRKKIDKQRCCFLFFSEVPGYFQKKSNVVLHVPRVVHTVKKSVLGKNNNINFQFYSTCVVRVCGTCVSQYFLWRINEDWELEIESARRETRREALKASFRFEPKIFSFLAKLKYFNTKIQLTTASCLNSLHTLLKTIVAGVKFYASGEPLSERTRYWSRKYTYQVVL